MVKEEISDLWDTYVEYPEWKQVNTVNQDYLMEQFLMGLRMFMTGIFRSVAPLEEFHASKVEERESADVMIKMDLILWRIGEIRNVTDRAIIKAEAELARKEKQNDTPQD